MRFMPWLLVGLAVALVAPTGTRAEESKPTSLLVYPKAEDVSYETKDDVWWVYYSVRAEYPAEQVLRFIRKELKRQGWEPLKEDYLNPGVLSSHVKGWRSYVDGRTSPRTKVHQWLGHWKNAQGDVVLYALKYQHPVGMSIPNHIRVMGNYYPAHVVKRQEQWAEEERRRTKSPKAKE